MARRQALTLSLVVTGVQRAGHKALACPQIVALARFDVVLMLLKTLTSGNQEVFETSLMVFSQLFTAFKRPLKMELGVLFVNVLLKILQTTGSVMHQRLGVLALLKDVCSQEQTLVDMFANYDLDMGQVDVFISVVTEVSKLLQSNPVARGSNGE